MNAPAIELREVHKNFGSTRIIQGVSLSIAQGERHAIIGPNGAGKSTLYNLISGRSSSKYILRLPPPVGFTSLRQGLPVSSGLNLFKYSGLCGLY